METLLKNQRLPYGLLYLDNMDEGDAIQSALFEKTGQKTVPNVFVSGQHIGEYKDKLEDMDVSLIFCHRPKWAMIFIRSL